MSLSVAWRLRCQSGGCPDPVAYIPHQRAGCRGGESTLLRGERLMQIFVVMTLAIATLLLSPPDGHGASLQNMERRCQGGERRACAQLLRARCQQGAQEACGQLQQLQNERQCRQGNRQACAQLLG